MTPSPVFIAGLQGKIPDETVRVFIDLFLNEVRSFLPGFSMCVSVCEFQKVLKTLEEQRTPLSGHLPSGSVRRKSIERTMMAILALKTESVGHMGSVASKTDVIRLYDVLVPASVEPEPGDLVKAFEQALDQLDSFKPENRKNIERTRRRYAKSFHPDKVQESLRDLASKYMSQINHRIDEILDFECCTNR